MALVRVGWAKQPSGVWYNLNMQIIAALEGPDGCGKTNIGQELARRLNVPYFKNQRESMFFEADPGYFVRAMKYGDPYVCSLLKQTGHSVILDRSYPSEWVYSQAFSRPTDMKMLGLVDGMYADVGLKIVVPYRTNYSKVKDQFAAINEQKLLMIHELYSQFCEWTKCDTLRICVDDEDLERQMSIIIPFVTGK